MTELPPTDGDGTDEPDSDEGAPTPAELVVASRDDEAAGQPSTEIEEPARLLRIAAMIKSLLSEVRETDLDEAGRRRLADIHSRAINGLSELISEDLRDELEEVGLVGFGEELPTGSEIRVAQAQLAGWLEGLFRGIQASIANQQLMAQAQLAQQAQAKQGSGGRRGQYL